MRPWSGPISSDFALRWIIDCLPDSVYSIRQPVPKKGWEIRWMTMIRRRETAWSRSWKLQKQISPLGGQSGGIFPPVQSKKVRKYRILKLWMMPLFAMAGQMQFFCLLLPTYTCTEQYFRLFFDISAAQFVAVGQIAAEWLRTSNNSSCCGCQSHVDDSYVQCSHFEDKHQKSLQGMQGNAGRTGRGVSICPTAVSW